MHQNNPNNAQGQRTYVDNEQCGTKNATSVATKSSINSASTSSSSVSQISITAGSGKLSLSMSLISSGSSLSKSSTSPASSSSGTASAADASPSSPPHKTVSSLSTGAAADIGVGCTLVFLLIIGAIFFLFRRRRRSTITATSTVQPPPQTPGYEKHSKAELHGDLAKSSSSGLWSADIDQKPEMFTDANRHEMEDTQIGATLEKPWLAELPEHGHD